MNGSFSQAQMGSFEAPSQSPAPTPPPPRPGSQQQQQQMNYGMNGGHMMPPNNYGSYPEPNMFAQPQHYQQSNPTPQIYTVRHGFRGPPPPNDELN